MWRFIQSLRRAHSVSKSGNGILKKTSGTRRGTRPSGARFRPNLEDLEVRLVPSFADANGAVITNVVEQSNGAQLLISFDGSLNPGPATTVSNYSVEVPSANPEVVTSATSSVAITSATYNSTTFQVTLNLGSNLAAGTAYRVFINGAGSADAAQAGLTDTNGSPIDGDFDDTRSGDFYALFAWTTNTTPLAFTDSGGYAYTLSLTGPGQLQTWRALDGDFDATDLALQVGLSPGAIQQITVSNGVLGSTTLAGSPATSNGVVVVPSIAGQGITFTNALPPYFQLTAPPLPTPPAPVVATASNLPYTLQVEQVSSDLPDLQSPVVAEDNVVGSPFNGYWLMFGGRTNGLHDFNGSNDFPPDAQNENIYAVNPVTWQTFTLAWSATDVSAATAQPLYSSNQESFQQGDTLYTVGGYGDPDLGGGTFAPNYTTYDTLTALSVNGLITAVVDGGSVTTQSQLQQIQDARLQVTGGEMQMLGGQAFLVLGQNFQGNYFSATATQTYIDEIQSFQINYNGAVPASLSITNYQAQNDQVNFRRRDYSLGTIIQPGLQPGLEAYGGVFTPGAQTDPSNGQGYQTPIVVNGIGATQVGPYQQYFSQYSVPNIGLYSAGTQSMYTIFMGGISLYDYNFATGQLTEDTGLPFVDDVTTLQQTASGGQEYEMPSQLPGYYGAEARFFATPGLPQYSNGVFQLDQLSQPTTLGFMFGGILSTVPETSDPGTQTSSTNAIFRIVLVPTATTTPVSLPLAPTITISHGQSAAIGLQTLDPSPSGPVNYTATIVDPLLSIKTQYGLTLQDGYFNYRGQDEKYLLSNNGSNPAGRGWFVLMPDGDLYDYVQDANNDLNATLATAPLTALAPSVWNNPSLLANNTGVAMATSGTNPLYDLKIELGLGNPAEDFNDRDANEWYIQSTNRSNPSGGGWYVLMPDNKLYAWQGNAGALRLGTLSDLKLVADFNLAPYSADVYANPTLLTGATLPTAAAIPFTISTASGGTLTLSPIAGFDRSVSVTVTATDNVNSFAQTFTFTVTSVAPSIAPVSNVVVNHSAPVSPTVPVAVTDPDPDGALRTFSVSVSGYNPLYDLQAQDGLNRPDQTQYFDYRLQNEKYLRSSNGSNPAGSGYYVLMPTDKLYAYVPDLANDLMATLAKAPVADFTQSPYTQSGNVYNEPALLYAAAMPASPTVASNRGPLYDVQTQYGLTTPDIAAEFNMRGQFEKYLLSTNGSNAAGLGLYVLMPTEKLYAYVPDAANDLVATLANPPAADFTLPQYAGVGNVYANPQLLYAATPAFINDPLFALKQQDGLTTSDLAQYFNFRQQAEKYLQSSNGSNPAGGGYYVLMPTDKLYAYVPDMNNDLTATLANAPVADFTQATYATFLAGGNVYSTPSLLYASTGQVAAVTATVGASGVITLTPNIAFVGTVRITVTVSDGAESGSQSFLFTVNDQAPTITPITTSPVTVSSGTSTTIAFTPTTFNNAPVLQAASVDNPSITTSFPSLGTLLLGWPNGFTGTFTLTIFVGDGALETQQEWLVTVN